jgi:deoxyribodipyrimidine photo-lyase
MKFKKGIFWFRNDLRLIDNPAFIKALEDCDTIIPLFVIDERWFKKLDLGFKKTGMLRAAFMLQSLQNLKSQLKQINSDLLVFTGKPEQMISDLVHQYQVDAIYASKEVTWEELKIEEALEYQVKSLGAMIHYTWQHTLVNPEDLPFEFTNLPDVFSAFRKKAEKYGIINKPLLAPENINLPKGLPSTSVPTLATLGFADEPIHLRYKGGEEEAWLRLEKYVWQQDQLKNYKYTRNGLLGEDYSSKFSPWLAHGCISARSIYHQVKKYEVERKKNISTYWLVFELYWRDYFRFISAKYGKKLFLKSGIKDNPVDLKDDWHLFDQWTSATTGIPFIDANMKELNQTGFMSNRGRQNVASFLVKDLKINWTWGAAYFENKLIDYDVSSNWGNWAYVAGVGNDPRQNRYFNIIKQAKQYDPKGDFVKYWLPQLQKIDEQYIHFPGLLTNEQLQQAGVKIGKNYAKNIVPFQKWLKNL